MNTQDIQKAILAGVIATAAMSAVAAMAPLMGMPPMNPAAMLASQMGGSIALGWAAHFMIGIILALAFALVLRSRLPGPAPVKGALFAIAPWLMAQLVMMPMMGMGLFSGSALMAGGSLMGHLVFGSVLGLVYRPSQAGATTYA
ncbi:MAG: DUF2938 domain-containing protein [Oligoflexia bacterium]|nr:DUF2938 domain-containing protein [Oligoflexia bacterium]